MTKRKASVALDNGNDSDQSSTQDNNSNSTTATNSNSVTNNQGIQNGVAAGSGGERQQIGQDNGNQQKSKKERADNWSSAEIQVLHRGIETRRDIFYGPPSQATKKNRELAWDAITKEVNSVSTTPRSLSQVMKKFKNEKCRAKRKFIDAEKDGHNNISNNNNNDVSNSTNNNHNLSAQNHNPQIQSQPHHMTTAESMSSQPSSINVVKLAPQNVAKTMIDLPGHVQMQNDDMLLIVPSEMDTHNIVTGLNIVSDGSSHYNFQKCPNNTLNNQHQNHNGQHTLQAINTGQGLVNGTMGNGMVARAIPAGSMCSLVYSTGGDVCGTDQHLTNSVAVQNQISTNHIGVNAQNLMHHRASVEQNQAQQQHQHQQQQHQTHHHHQLHQHQPQQQAPQQQHQQSQHPIQSHQTSQHHQHHLQQNHVATTTAITNNGGGVALESQLKNLLFNLLLKDGQHTIPSLSSVQDQTKHKDDMLAMIANSLNKIEGHLSKISKVASSLFAQSINSNPNDNGGISTPASLSTSNNSLSINNNDGTNNNVSIIGTGSANNINNQTGTEA